MKTENIELIKEYLSMSYEKSQEYADSKCFYCEKYNLNNGVGKRKCKFASICDKEREILKKMIR